MPQGRAACIEKLNFVFKSLKGGKLDIFYDFAMGLFQFEQ